jgi:cell division protein FtsN
VYQQRRLSRHLEVPEGYRRVWEDDRLNGRRTMRTLKPAVITSSVSAPQGYVYVERDDDRYNPQRGLRTAGGDQQMAAVWTDTVPRKLVELPLDRQIVKSSYAAARSPAEADQSVMRLSTRSAPDAGAVQEMPRKRYVRAATYADAADAAAAAKKLSALGLPVRLGNLTRGGTLYKVVLAGPFTVSGNAEQALTRVRRAGYGGARLSK